MSFKQSQSKVSGSEIYLLITENSLKVMNIITVRLFDNLVT